MFTNSPFTTIDTASIQIHPVVFSKEGVLTNFAKFTRKYLRKSLLFKEIGDLQSLALSKKIFPDVSCEFCEISQTQATSVLTVILFTVQPRPFAFSKTISHIFSDWVFSRLGTRVNPIFQTLSQKPEAYFQPTQTSAMEIFLRK